MRFEGFRKNEFARKVGDFEWVGSPRGQPLARTFAPTSVARKMAVCVSLFPIEVGICRWLTASGDALPSGETHFPKLRRPHRSNAVCAVKAGHACHHIECARRLILSSTVQPLTDAQVYWADAGLARLKLHISVGLKQFSGRASAVSAGGDRR